MKPPWKWGSASTHKAVSLGQRVSGLDGEGGILGRGSDQSRGLVRERTIHEESTGQPTSQAAE